MLFFGRYFKINKVSVCLILFFSCLLFIYTIYGVYIVNLSIGEGLQKLTNWNIFISIFAEIIFFVITIYLLEFLFKKYINLDYLIFILILSELYWSYQYTVWSLERKESIVIMILISLLILINKKLNYGKEKIKKY